MCQLCQGNFPETDYPFLREICFFALLTSGWTNRLEDEIVINGEVYVRKVQAQALSPSPPPPPGPAPPRVAQTERVVESIQEKLARKKQHDLIQNSDNDNPDGIPMSLQAIKQKLR